MTRITQATVTTTTAQSDAALRDMAFVLRLTGKIAAEIRSDKSAAPATTRRVRAGKLAAV